MQDLVSLNKAGSMIAKSQTGSLVTEVATSISSSTPTEKKQYAKYRAPYIYIKISL